MTVEEFSDQFDILYNNITSNQAPGLDEYEKSIFLTRAQEDIVKGYFDPLLNKTQQGFDGSERRQIDFSMLIKSAVIEPTAETFAMDSDGFDPRAYIVPLYELSYADGPLSKKEPILAPVLLFLNEKLRVVRNGKEIDITVSPLSYTAYNTLMDKPYKRPTKWQAWRLLDNKSDGGSFIDNLYIIPGSNDKPIRYSCRYLKRPRPIILQELPEEGPTIDGETESMTSELDPILHKEIVQRAVELAKAVYTGDLTTQIALGQTSQTGLGIVTRGGKE